MKEIKNWKALIKDEFGNEEIGILLPGCIIQGELEEKYIEIETIDVNITDLTVTSTENELYLLSYVNREYISILNKCIEIGIKQRDGEER